MLSTIIEIVVVVAIIGLQEFFGYLKNLYLGMILPILSIVALIFLIATGHWEWSLHSVLIPLIGFFALLGIYFDGENRKKKKEKQELDTMKAKDSLKH